MSLTNFNSWGEYLTECTRTPTGNVRVSSVNGSSSFTDTSSYDEAMKLATEGWHSAEADARKLSNALVRRVGALVERDEEFFDVEGQAVDVSLFNQGIPECMVRYEARFEQSPGPIVKMVYNGSASAGIGTRMMIAKGAAAAGLIECIELSGKSVELWMVQTTGDHEHRVKVKDAGQPLDMGRVMFALAHPSSFRRLGFRMVELHTGYLTHHSYGMPCETYGDRGDIYIGRQLLGEPQWTDEDATAKWVVEKLREQNIEVRDETVPTN